MAEWLRSGLQSRLHRFDSGRRLLRKPCKDSRKTLGKAWQKSSRPAAGYLTRAQAEAAAQEFLGQHAEDGPDARRTFSQACEVFITLCQRERGLRETTLHDYRRITRALGARA